MRRTVYKYSASTLLLIVTGLVLMPGTVGADVPKWKSEYDRERFCSQIPGMMRRLNQNRAMIKLLKSKSEQEKWIFAGMTRRPKSKGSSEKEPIGLTRGRAESNVVQKPKSGKSGLWENTFKNADDMVQTKNLSYMGLFQGTTPGLPGVPGKPATGEGGEDNVWVLVSSADYEAVQKDRGMDENKIQTKMTIKKLETRQVMDLIEAEIKTDEQNLKDDEAKIKAWCVGKEVKAVEEKGSTVLGEKVD